MHKSITQSRVLRLAKAAAFGPGLPKGICISCGKTSVIEEDAHEEKCPHCKKDTLWGASMLLIAGRI